jgi:hypothetical protein
LKDRIVLRRIESDLPERIIREAQRYFTDTATGYQMAVADGVYRGGNHLMMVAFEETESDIIAITIHPLDERDVNTRLEPARWVQIHSRFLPIAYFGRKLPPIPLEGVRIGHMTPSSRQMTDALELRASSYCSATRRQDGLFRYTLSHTTTLSAYERRHCHDLD